MTRHERQVSLASSYYPILIDTTSIPNDPEPQPRAQSQARGHGAIPKLNSNPTTSRMRMRYPIPLMLLGLADIIYSISTYTYTSSTSPLKSVASPSIHLMILACVRAVVSIVGVGMSKTWRFRGGWIGSLSVVSLGCVVWEGCKGQLVPRRTVDGDLEKVDTEFLIITAVFAITEFITFMLLLRLSPPPNRQNPFSLRLPNSAIQTPTAFHYSERPEPAYQSTPTRRRYRNLSHDYRPGPPISYPVDTSAPHTPARGIEPDREEYIYEDEDGNGDIEDEVHPHHELYDNDNENESENDETDDFDDSVSLSSISDSSIIDLPPPLEPNRLLPPSVSLNSGLNLAALDSSPVFGPLIRRTRSARFTSIRILGRSDSGSGLARGGARERERELSDGYGTFQHHENGGARQGVGV